MPSSTSDDNNQTAQHTAPKRSANHQNSLQMRQQAMMFEIQILLTRLECLKHIELEDKEEHRTEIATQLKSLYMRIASTDSSLNDTWVEAFVDSLSDEEFYSVRKDRAIDPALDTKYLRFLAGKLHRSLTMAEKLQTRQLLKNVVESRTVETSTETPE